MSVAGHHRKTAVQCSLQTVNTVNSIIIIINVDV